MSKFKETANGVDDIFSTAVIPAAAIDKKPENPLWDRASYAYDLPESQIAQVPLADRADSRMLVLDRETGEYKDDSFRNIISYLNPGDVLVINNTKVIPARVFGELGDGTKVELLLIRPDTYGWKVMLNHTLLAGDVIHFKNDGEECGTATIVKHAVDNSYVLSFDSDVWDLLDKIGHTPLPPYIGNQEKLEEEGIAERYNTVYSKEMTSVAAPTAGLHFTPEILNQLTEKGVKILDVRLDVGLGTFRPVVVNDIRHHYMHTEHIVVKQSVIEEIKEARSRGSKVIAVGTTSLRTLESIPQKVWDTPANYESDTSIFIYPGSGCEVKSIDGLLTNFHAPESTLMMLVSVVAGYDNIMNAYKHAVESGYRFMSLGDCMLIKPHED